MKPVVADFATIRKMEDFNNLENNDIMPTEYIIACIPLIIAVIGGLGRLGVHIMKKLSQRLDALEGYKNESLSRKETKELINEKLTPVNNRLDRIEGKLDKIIDIMLHKS